LRFECGLPASGGSAFFALAVDETMTKDKVRVTDLAQMKAERTPIAMLTAYDFPFARIFDAAGVDVLLVGDSLGMVVQGADSTLAVTLDEVIYHTRMVARARQRALVVADLPFLTYQVSVEKALAKSGRLIKINHAPNGLGHRDNRTRLDPDVWDWCRRRMRWPGAGDARRARTQRIVLTALRQALCASVAGSVGRSGQLYSRSARTRLPNA
jgi:hypothetical protein